MDTITSFDGFSSVLFWNRFRKMLESRTHSSNKSISGAQPQKYRKAPRQPAHVCGGGETEYPSTRHVKRHTNTLGFTTPNIAGVNFAAVYQ